MYTKYFREISRKYYEERKKVMKITDKKILRGVLNLYSEDNDKLREQNLAMEREIAQLKEQMKFRDSLFDLVEEKIDTLSEKRQYEDTLALLQEKYNAAEQSRKEMLAVLEQIAGLRGIKQDEEDEKLRR